MIATIRTAVALAAAAFATSVLAQQVVYPAKKQSAEQQKKDESQCHQWAVQNTGIDPSKQAAATPPPTTAAVRRVVRWWAKSSLMMRGPARLQARSRRADKAAGRTLQHNSSNRQLSNRQTQPI